MKGHGNRKDVFFSCAIYERATKPSPPPMKKRVINETITSLILKLWLTAMYNSQWLQLYKLCKLSIWHKASQNDGGTTRSSLSLDKLQFHLRPCVHSEIKVILKDHIIRSVGYTCNLPVVEMFLLQKGY